MKLSEARPCAKCNGPLLRPPAGQWYVIDVSTAMVSPRAAREVMGLDMIFGGGALGLAEVMAPAADQAIMILGDENPELKTRIHLCFICAVTKPVELLELIETVNRRKEKEAEAGEC